MGNQRRVVIFGGAFSPPTLAHEAIIAALLALPHFDEIWVMPSGDRLDKDMTARDADRLAMLDLVRQVRFVNDSRLKISDFELRMPRPSQTFQTVRALEQAFPGVAFWFAFGPDSYASMPSWPRGVELQHALRIVLFSSGGPSVPAKKEVVRVNIPATLGDTSSTQARRLAADGGSLQTQVSSPVARYIQTHALYAG
ncbi:MAG: nicotinate-nicotinamide nucleotide adenylyltransferase [Candidatus Saccharimonadales bacterium]